MRVADDFLLLARYAPLFSTITYAIMNMKCGILLGLHLKSLSTVIYVSEFGQKKAPPS